MTGPELVALAAAEERLVGLIAEAAEAEGMVPETYPPEVIPTECGHGVMVYLESTRGHCFAAFIEGNPRRLARELPRLSAFGRQRKAAH